MKVPAVLEMLRAIPPERRSEFAYDICKTRKERGTDKWGEVAGRVLFIHQTLGLKAA